MGHLSTTSPRTSQTQASSLSSLPSLLSSSAATSTTASSVETSLSKTDAVVRQYYEARRSHEKVLSFLLRHGYESVNSKKRRLLKSSYPLHRAVKRNDPEMIQLLLTWGADSTQVDSSKRTPLEYAQHRDRRGSHEEVLSLLEAADAAAECERGREQPPCDEGGGAEARQGHQWESFLKQLASDPLVSRRRLAAIAPQVTF